MRGLALRLARGSALAGFAVGGLVAGVEAWRTDFVLEFQAGPASTWTERASAVAQTAAIDGLGFGFSGLVLAALALLVVRWTSAARTGQRVVATFLLLAGALCAWLSATWAAEALLPFLAPASLALLDLAGIACAAGALWLFRALVGRLPWSARGAPVARTLASLALALPLGIFAQALLRDDRSPEMLILVACLFLSGLPAAAWLSRPVQRAVAAASARMARGPLLSPWPGRVLGLGLLACAIGSATNVEMSPVPRSPDYGRLAGTSPPPAGPNVVLVTIDTLRADHLGCYGYERPTSPFLDELADAGTRFADPVAAAAWTKPATGTILTGLYPSRHGALYHGSSLRLPDGARTLAQAFQDAGYVTAGFVSNPNVKAVFDFDRGFDLYFDSPVEDTLTRACIRRSLFGAVLMKLTRHQFNWKYENDVRQMDRHVESWLAENHDQRFFLYVHLIDPHVPYAPPSAYREEFLQDHGLVFHNERKKLVGADLYDAEIRYTDDGLRELFGRFEELGIADDTLFVVTSDHGEEFFEHGVLGHGFSLFQPVLRVPLIFRGPGIPAGRVVEEPVQILDLAATMLDAAGLEIESFNDGRSFANCFRNSAWAPAPEYFLENEFGQDDSNQREFVLTGVRKGRWKLVLTEANAFFPPQHPGYGREALYDLERDPEERENLIARKEHRELVQDLLADLQDHAEFLYATGFRTAKPAALTPDVEASLRALGY